jgi:alpha-L-fucosidase
LNEKETVAISIACKKIKIALCGAVTLLAVSGNRAFSADITDQTPAEDRALHLRNERLEWFQDQRYGMFIHWGPSVIHGGRYDYTDLSWSRGGTPPDPWCGGGPIPPDLYDDSFKTFNPTEYDPAAWVQLAKDAGMRYIVFTSRHHDSFSMFDTKQSQFKITSPQGAYRQWIAAEHPQWTDERINRNADILRRLADAVHAAGLGFGIYYSEPDWIREDYRIALTGKNLAGQTVSQQDRQDALQSYQDFMDAQLEELTTLYGKVDILWLDAIKPSQVKEHGWNALWIRRDTLERVRRHQPGILLNDRHGFEPDYQTPENENAEYKPGVVQESCQHVGKQWAWTPNDTVPPLKWFIDRIVMNASRNSNLLMNMGPSPTGVFDAAQSERLREVGRWLIQHEIAVLGTRGGPVIDNRPDPAYVTMHKESRIYVHILYAEKAGGEIRLPGVTIDSVCLFDAPAQKLSFRNENEIGIIQLPDTVDSIDEILIVEGRFDINDIRILK